MINGLYEFSESDAISFARFIGTKCFRKGNELTFDKCPYCGGGHKDRNTFSINLITGQFKCLRASCDAHGNMITLAKDFDGFELSEDVTRYLAGNDRRGRFKGFKNSEKKAESTDRTIEFFKGRGISENICRQYELTESSKAKPGDFVIVFPFRDENGIMRFVKYRNGNYVKDQSQGSKEWCEPNQMPILFGMYQCNLENKTLVLTEGQIDSLSVAESGIENAISVPTGCNGFTWIPHCWEWLHSFDEIIVFGDYEKGRMTLLDTISKRIQFLKVRSVCLEDYQDCKDANEILQKYGREQIRKCIENAKPLPIKKVKSIADVPIEYTADMERVKTGFPTIDRMLGGGLPFGGVTVISGKAGEGKSTLASQLILEAASQGFGCFVYSGELMNSRFKEWFYLQVAGSENLMSYKNYNYGIEYWKISDDKVKKIDDWLDGKVFIYDSDDIQMDDEDSNEKESLVTIIENSIKQYDTRVVLIDNLMTAMGTEADDAVDQYAQQTKFMKQLVRLAIKYNAMILLVAHKKKDGKGSNDDISGSANIANLAMVTLFFGKANKEDEDERLFQVKKNRITGRVDGDGGIRTQYDEKSRRLAEIGNDVQLKKEYLNFAESWMSIEDMPDEIPWGD